MAHSMRRIVQPSRAIASRAMGVREPVVARTGAAVSAGTACLALVKACATRSVHAMASNGKTAMSRPSASRFNGKPPAGPEERLRLGDRRIRESRGGAGRRGGDQQEQGGESYAERGRASTGMP